MTNLQILDFRSIKPQHDLESYQSYRFDGKYRYLCPIAHPEESLIERAKANAPELKSDQVCLTFEQAQSELPAECSRTEVLAALFNANYKFVLGKFYRQGKFKYEGLKPDHLTTDKKIILTTYIGGTGVCKSFIEALVTFCKTFDAEVHLFYKAPRLTQDIDWEEVVKVSQLFGKYGTLHLNGDVYFNNRLKVYTTANVHHTAVQPLSQVKYSIEELVIIPHARQEAEVTANHDEGRKSLLYSTGTISNLSLGRTQAEAKTRFHSVLGAVLFNPKSEYPLINLNWSEANNNFYYFNQKIEKDTVSPGTIHSAYLDDLHCAMVKPEYVKRVNSLLHELKPQQVGSGDVLDGMSVNYHESDRLGFSAYRMSLKEELRITKEVLKAIMEGLDSKLVILSSNHHDFFNKFIKNPSSLSMLDSEDLVLVLKTMAYMVENTKNEKYKGIKYANSLDYLLADVDFKSEFDDLPGSNVHLNLHGHEFGVGSASTQGNVKITHGHTHSPKITKGTHVVGTSFREANYQSGINKAASAISALADNGKRQMFFKVQPD